MNFLIYAKESNVYEPTKYYEAINCKDGDLWRKSMDDEFEAHNKLGTWEVIEANEMPEKASVVTSMGLQGER